MGNRTINGIRGVVYPVSVELVVWECPVQGCGVVYGLPKSYADRLRSKAGGYYCPNGHYLSWNETDADRERKRADRLAEQLRVECESAEFWREREQQTQRSLAATKGHLTRMKSRIANGVCPVPGCKRSGFANVMRHVAAKHPTWHAEHAHDLAAPIPGGEEQ